MSTPRTNIGTLQKRKFGVTTMKVLALKQEKTNVLRRSCVDWVNKLLALDPPLPNTAGGLSTDERITSGVLLCELALIIDDSAVDLLGRVHLRARPSTLLAGENVESFLRATAAWGVKCDLSPADIISTLQSNESNLVYALYSLSTVAYKKFGVTPPQIVALGANIDKLDEDTSDEEESDVQSPVSDDGISEEPVTPPTKNDKTGLSEEDHNNIVNAVGAMSLLYKIHPLPLPSDDIRGQFVFADGTSAHIRIFDDEKSTDTSEDRILDGVMDGTVSVLVRHAEDWINLVEYAQNHEHTTSLSKSRMSSMPQPIDSVVDNHVTSSIPTIVDPPKVESVDSVTVDNTVSSDNDNADNDDSTPLSVIMETDGENVDLSISFTGSKISLTDNSQESSIPIAVDSPSHYDTVTTIVTTTTNYDESGPFDCATHNCRCPCHFREASSVVLETLQLDEENIELVVTNSTQDDEPTAEDETILEKQKDTEEGVVLVDHDEKTTEENKTETPVHSEEDDVLSPLPTSGLSLNVTELEYETVSESEVFQFNTPSPSHYALRANMLNNQKNGITDVLNSKDFALFKKASRTDTERMNPILKKKFDEYEARKEFFFLTCVSVKLNHPLAVENNGINSDEDYLSTEMLWEKAIAHQIPFHGFHEFVKKEITLGYIHLESTERMQTRKNLRQHREKMITVLANRHTHSQSILNE